jgi:hypothetical protein
MRSFARKLILPLLVVAASTSVTLVAYRAFAQDAGVAASQPTATSPVDAAVTAGDPGTLAQRTYEAVQAGQYAPAAILALIALVWGLRKWGDKLPVIGPRLHGWSNTDRGGACTVFVTALLGAILHTVSAGGFAAVNGSTLKAGLIIGLGAIGGFTGARKILFPSDKVVPVIDSTEAKTDPAGKPTPPVA